MKILTMRGRNMENNENMVFTNILPFDMLKTFYGGSFVQLAGESCIGKTTIALQLALAFCQSNKRVLFIDANNTITDFRLKQCGLSNYLDKEFVYSKINSFEEVEEFLDENISTKKFNLIIIDALPALINTGYLNLKRKGRDKGISIMNNNTNYDSRPLNLFIRKYKAVACEYNLNFLLINDFRNKIVMPKGTVEKRFGVKSLDCASTTILELISLPNKAIYRKFKDIFKPLNNGTTLAIKVVKSNTCKPDFLIPIFLEFGLGLSLIHNIIFYCMTKSQKFEALTLDKVSNYKSSSIQFYLKNRNEILEFYLKENF